MNRLVAVVTLAAAILMAAPASAGPIPAEGPQRIPHTLQGTSTCMSCHDPVKGARPAPQDHKGRPIAACTLCHAPPDEHAAASLRESTESCRSCHRSGNYGHVADIGAQTDIQRQVDNDRQFAHHRLACVTCHGEAPHADMHAITRRSVATKCGQCHNEQLAIHRDSVHGRSLDAGGKDAASCVDCHSTEGTPHSIVRVLSTASPAYRSAVAATCARCHARDEVMSKYGVPTEVYKTYMSTFHGKANVLSKYEITQHPKATCISCHGFHDVREAKDPKSPVHHANLAKTCGTCHPGAGEKFAAGWMGHTEATPQQYPIVYWAERFFLYLTASVLTFGFIFMVLLDLVSTLLRRKAGPAHAKG